MKAERDILAAVSRALAPEKDIGLAMVYGSAAAGDLRPDSDVDVAVASADALTGGRVDMRRRMDLALVLEAAVQRPVEVVDMQDAHCPFLSEIVRHGTVVKDENRDIHAYFMLRMLYEEEDWMPLWRRMIQQKLDRSEYV